MKLKECVKPRRTEPISSEEQVTARRDGKPSYYHDTNMKNYDKYQIGRMSRHARKVTIGMAKAERLRVKNERRAKNVLPPLKSYAEV
jgi:hypothetical protein